MKLLLLLLLLSVAMQAQSFTASSSSALPDAPSQQPFWTVENKVNVSILAGLVAADAITTQRGLDQGLAGSQSSMRPFVTRGAGRRSCRVRSRLWRGSWSRISDASLPPLQSGTHHDAADRRR